MKKLSKDQGLVKGAKVMSFYTIGNLLNAGIPFFLLPFLTRFFTEEEFGVLAVYQMVVMFLIPVVSLGGETMVTKKYHEVEEKRLKQYWSGSIQISSGVFLLLLVASVPILFVSGGWLGLSHPLFIAAISFAFLTKMVEIYLAWLRMEGKALAFGVFRVVRSIVDIGFSIVLVKYWSSSVESRVAGQWIATVVLAAIVLYIQYRRGFLGFKVNKADLRWLMLFGFPIAVHSIGGVCLNFIDRALIENIVGLPALGVYAVAYQVGLAIHLLQNSFNLAWVPWFFKSLNSKTEEAKHQVVVYTWLYAAGLLLVSVVFALMVPLIFDWFIDQRFHGAQHLVYFIILGYYFNGLYKMMVNYLIFANKTTQIAVATLIATAFNIGLNLYLIPKLGIKGAAITTVFTFLFHFLLTLYFSVRAFPMPWLNRRKLAD